MPDIEAYYNVSQHQFVYLDDGRWIFAAALPERCRDYDLYRGYKVVINGHGRGNGHAYDHDKDHGKRD